ncbi:CEP63 protein, partial [Semnornis frantzii]|nr:CEP63 protein [Semnornis frantzii]
LELLGGACFVTGSSYPGSGGFLTSCEAELQELMKQIDVMVAHKKAEWEDQTQALEACLSAREKELVSTRAALQEAQKESVNLRHQLQEVGRSKQEMARGYQQELKKFQEELSRLRRNYEKLQRKQLREAREGNKRQGEEQSEMSRLTRNLEEFHQRSLDWEKQRLHYQQQVASLEAQRKALTEQSELIQRQLASWKQDLELAKLAGFSQIQHLTSKLERANDTICAKELELERLNMRVNDLTENNQTILEDEQRVQEELRQSKKMLEMLEDEKMKLKATLQSQEDFIGSSKLHEEHLQKELARANKALQTKELLIRALEEHLQEQQLSSSAGLQRVLEQLTAAQRKEQHLQSELSQLEYSLASSNVRCAELSAELDGNTQELRSLQEQHAKVRAEAEKLKEQLSQAAQIHKSELEGMRREVCRLVEELHQRDITIASASNSTSNLQQQLRAEIERAERKAVEHRAIVVQLETLRLENLHLVEMLDSAKRGGLQGKGGTSTAHGEDSAAELNKLKAENQQLQNDLAEARAQLEFAQQLWQDEAQGTAQQMEDEEPEARDGQCRAAQDLQYKLDQQAEGTHHKPEENAQHQQGGPQKWEAAEMRSMSPEDELPSHSSWKSGMEPFAVDTLLGTDSLCPVLDGNKDSSDEAPEQSSSQQQRASVPLNLLPRASVETIAARYLQEEELRSQSITECLNRHIKELKQTSEAIVRQFQQQN